MKFIFLLVGILVAGFWWHDDSPTWTLNGAESHAQVPPEQDEDDYYGFDFKGYTVTPLAEFTINAKVLSRKDYSHDRAADFSPVDLALGWGDMANPDVLGQINITQSGRWYYWKTDALPIPRRAIETQSANMHIIPADELVEDELDDVDRGDVVRLRGHLVRVEGDDGWSVASSLTRNDTGGGACEVVFVESLDILNL